jgi:hypothetical protein
MLNYQRVEYDRMEHIPKNQSCLGGGVIHFFPLILSISFSSFHPPISPQKAGDDPDKLLGDGSTTNSDLEKYVHRSNKMQRPRLCPVGQ